MGIRHCIDVTPTILRDHRDRIALCRGSACKVEMGQVFGTSESNELERIIDGRTARRNELGVAQWSRKYDRYDKGTVPDLETVAKAEAAATVLGKLIRLRLWREHPLWTLLKEPVVSLETIRAIMAGLPRKVCREIYDLSDPNHQGEYSRHDFTRKHTLALRDLGTLDAFVGLLALAREGEIIVDEPRHWLPTLCAFEIFPLVLLDNPHFNARWEELYAAVELAFWRRVYHSGGHPAIYTLENAKFGFESVRRDRSVKLPWSAGIVGPASPWE